MAFDLRIVAASLRPSRRPVHISERPWSRGASSIQSALRSTIEASVRSDREHSDPADPRAEECCLLQPSRPCFLTTELGLRYIFAVKSLQDHVAMVTGGTFGVGRGIANALAQAGAQVFVTGRTAHDHPIDEHIIGIRCNHRLDDEVTVAFE